MKDMQTEQLLSYSSMTDTEHKSSSNDEEKTAFLLDIQHLKGLVWR